MDWSKSKTILISLLLALNLVLAGFLINRELGDNVNNSFYANVTGILNDRGVKMSCKYPKRIKDSELLVYGDGSRYVDACAKALDKYAGDSKRVEFTGRESLRYYNPDPTESLNVGSAAAADASARRALKAIGIDLVNFKTDYTTNSFNDDGGFLIQYILEYNGNLVFDSNIKINLTTEGGISEITVNYREIKAVSDEKLMKVIPAYQVILKNYNIKGEVINAINIGFMGQNAIRDNPFIESKEGAVWRVRLEDGSERFFEATYGDEI